MQSFSFESLGTHWSIDIDEDILRDDTSAEVLSFLQDFERRFSRFRLESEVNAWRQASPGKYTLSPDLKTLLARAEKLRELTEGRYDPAVAGLLERAGYGAKLSNNSSETPEQFILPKWQLEGGSIVIDGPLVFDLGGMGKGYAIDAVAKLLEERGYRYFLVEGGGDMYGTTKRDGKPWQIAIEYPGQPDTALGSVDLDHSGLAVSDRFRRRFGRWHHVVDPLTKQAVDLIDGCAALSPSAWDADSLTAGIFLGKRESYARLAKAFAGEYLVTLPGGYLERSPHWPGILFVES